MKESRRTAEWAGWMLVVPALVAGVLLNILAPQPYMGLPLLAAAPLIAGAMLPFGAGVLVASLACGVSLLLDIVQGRTAAESVVDLAVVGLIGTLALAVNLLLQRQGRDLARARVIAEAVQLAVLPAPPSRAGPLAVASWYTPAQAEARIGGDLFAVQETPYGVRMIIGDVKGKGLQAVASVSVTIGAFRQEAENAPTLAELAQRLDDALSKEAARSGRETSGEDFTTAVLAEVPGDGGLLRLVNRGHPGPYLIHDGAVVRLDATRPQLPLGMGLGAVRAPGGDELTDVVRMPPGALLLMITDGVTEARDRTGTFYDPCASAMLAGARFRDPEDLVHALTEDVARWTGDGHQDDMAILAVARQTAPGPDGADAAHDHRASGRRSRATYHPRRP
ncbi:PP2C family protein-serine/threonine phosphatase [Streptomyces sp. NBC_01217]|uniref:PP2C family protein-serine/threonine phosphatase n=1 Tax=Streptomyces sp. NBC_01217 TaxID=2903779 RepID=UPI003FA38A6C